MIPVAAGHHSFSVFLFFLSTIFFTSDIGLDSVHI